MRLVGLVPGPFEQLTSGPVPETVEEQLRRAEKLSTLGEMAAVLAHEIRNPLVSIKTFVQLLPTHHQTYPSSIC